MFTLLHFYFWLLECCFAVWSSGWSTAERSIVNYASTDLLSHQVSTLQTRMDHPLWCIRLSFLNSFWGRRNFLPSLCNYFFIIIAFVEALKTIDGAFNLSLFFFFSLLPGHALTSAHPGHLCWPTDQCGNCHPLLVPLHTGGLRLARGGSSHSM